MTFSFVIPCRHVTDKCDANTQFTCRNFECIDKALRCDGVYHCNDKSDEYKCGELSLLHMFMVTASYQRIDVIRYVVKQVSDTMRYSYNGTLMDVCYTSQSQLLSGQLCAQLGQR